jgi:hypothetical protein
MAGCATSLSVEADGRRMPDKQTALTQGGPPSYSPSGKRVNAPKEKA